MKVGISRTAIPLVCICVALLVSACDNRHGGSPSLSDTLAWMDSTYNPHDRGWAGHGRIGETTVTFRYDGCRFTVRTDLDGGFVITETFDLSDIDPESIKSVKYNDVVPVVIFETHNQEPAVSVNKWSSARDKLPISTSTSDVSGFAFDDRQYAARFEKALRHAVALCGGHASTF